jgi:hypothetical protein
MHQCLHNGNREVTVIGTAVHSTPVHRYTGHAGSTQSICTDQFAVAQFNTQLANRSQLSRYSIQTHMARGALRLGGPYHPHGIAHIADCRRDRHIENHARLLYHLAPIHARYKRCGTRLPPLFTPVCLSCPCTVPARTSGGTLELSWAAKASGARRAPAAVRVPLCLVAACSPVLPHVQL